MKKTAIIKVKPVAVIKGTPAKGPTKGSSDGASKIKIAAAIKSFNKAGK